MSRLARGAFLRNEKRRRRLDGKLLGIISLIDGDSDAAPGIDVQ
jgi:hypothetical protein